jgi:hypothetical protein
MGSDSINLNDIVNSFFSPTTFEYLTSFLAIEFLVFIIVILFYDTGSNQSELPFIKGRLLNIFIFGFLIVYFVNIYSNMNDDDKENYLHDKLMSFKNFLNDYSSIFSVISFILGFYLIIYFLDVPMTNETKPLSIRMIDTIAWLLFVVLLICDFFNIFFNISIADSLIRGDFLDRLRKAINESRQLKDSSNNVKDTSGNQKTSYQIDEVFNVSNNLYTYDDAAAVCSVYGAKLATYDQVEEAYNKGGEWCNYGWSEGQLALFPTQKTTWSKLQESKTAKNNCGRPGVNGGYMENPDLLFGVNCYGKKPAATKNNLAAMDANREVLIPKTAEDSEVNEKVKIWKENPDQFLVINSFNRENWSEY